MEYVLMKMSLNSWGKKKKKNYRNAMLNISWHLGKVIDIFENKSAVLAELYKAERGGRHVSSKRVMTALTASLHNAF